MKTIQIKKKRLSDQIKSNRLQFALSMLTLLMLGVLTASSNATAKASSATALKSHFKAAFKMGVAVNDDIVSGKSRQGKAITEHHFNSITLENSMKAELVNPAPNVFNFQAADDFVAFGQAKNMFIVGHTLIWHNQTPDWFFVNSEGKPNTKVQQLARLQAHINVVASRYAGKVDAWDVVNEVIGEDGNYRSTNWVNAVGDGDTLVKAAFKYAQQYAPNTELYYNDFNAWRPEKRDGIVRMVKMLQAAGIRIDGVGIQAHWGLNFPSNQDITDAINAYSALGIKVMITELDVDVLPLTKEAQVIGQGFMHSQFQLPEFKKFLDPYPVKLPQDVEQQLSDRYRELFTLFYQLREKIDRVTFWGVEDSMSWKNNYPIPNRTNYPLLWNRDFHPKPALKAISEVAN
ncbi:endo-1,4-beta-xylanase [Thalassotalea sp. PLHSN55]|uniref:endo-1,4-beta-xylanase n=1 Tax=Thalassotalea sp. PLHSN55 TaxID=3435888 RepID=UPI003F826483